MNWQTRLFILFWSAVVIVLIGLMIMLYVSLIPHFTIIGDIAFVVLCIFLGYGVVLGGYGTYHLIATWALNRKVIVRGEVVAYLDKSNTFTHLSAMHEQAKIPPPAQVTVQEDRASEDDVVVELWQKGMSLRDIVKATGRKYHEVQKITSEQKH